MGKISGSGNTCLMQAMLGQSDSPLLIIERVTFTLLVSFTMNSFWYSAANN